MTPGTTCRPQRIDTQREISTMRSFRWSGRRKRRPREHVIADMGINFLERQALRRGHQLLRVPEPEYGTDALMRHFSPESHEIEDGWVEFQVKATDHLTFVGNGRFVPCVIDMAHLHCWYWQAEHPFILILYDAQQHRAFWLDIQSYVDQRNIQEDVASETVTLHIPSENKLSLRAIDLFRNMSLARMERP